MGGYNLAGSNGTEPSRGGGHIVVGGVVPYHPEKGIQDNMTGPPWVDMMMTQRTTHAPVEDETPILVYVLVPIGSLLLIILVSFLVVFILRKSRLDKLRHHLMPLYNFDPAEEEGDWESELLEEEKEKQMTRLVMSPSPTGGPKLKFTDNLDV